MEKRSLFKYHLIRIMLILITSLVFGLIFQVVLNVGDFLPGLIAGSVLIFLCGISLYLGWYFSGRAKALAWMMMAAFIFRIVFALFYTWGLPLYGYDERPQRVGFIFEDAFRREENAWSLALSDQPLTRAFSDDYETDQYGGMLALSALVFRTLSPDAYRPVLISILAAGAMAMSIPFLLAAMKPRFDAKAILWAGWILALLPDGILYGSAQLREPFFILFFVIIFYCSTNLVDGTKLRMSIPLAVLSTVSLILFSYRVAIPILGVMVLWLWVDFSNRIKHSWIKILIWCGIVISSLLLVYLIRDWLSAVLTWDMLLAISRSGRVQFHLESLPSILHFPFVLVYGIFQPVLPAALAAPAPWIWRGLGIFRAFGWYALLPLLIYGLVRVWSLAPSRKKRWLMVMVVMAWVWILVASARAGGDQWDNPRYRVIFLPWMVIIAGWGVIYAKEIRDHWLGRIFVVEGIFLAFFTNWYFSRYYQGIPRLEFGWMVPVILVLSVAVIFGGWLQDRKRSQHANNNEEL